MKVMLLAAGKGERLNRILGRKPKVLIPVAGKTLLEHNLRYLKKFGIKETVMNLHAFPEQIKAFLKRNRNFGLRVKYSHEKQLLGTAGAVKKAENLLRSKTILVLYGDNLLDFDIRQLIRQHQRRRAWVTLGVYHPRQTAWSGIAAGLIRVNGNGEVSEFVEKRNNRRVPRDRWVSAGIFAISRDVLKHIPKGKSSDFGRDIFPDLLRSGKSLQTFKGASYVLASDTPLLWKRTDRLMKKVIQSKGAS